MEKYPSMVAYFPERPKHVQKYAEKPGMRGEHIKIRVRLKLGNISYNLLDTHK
jgi:hypothetical protein